MVWCDGYSILRPFFVTVLRTFYTCFFIQLGESANDPPQIKRIFMAFVIQQVNTIKQKTATFHCLLESI